MAHQRVCYALRCGFTSDAPIDVCPKCGRRMRSTNSVRIYGVLQLILGLFLIIFMSVITINVLPMMLQPGQPEGGARFTGTSQQVLVILSLFGLIIAFGFGSSVAGLWQIITARRNKWIIWGVLGLSVLLWIVANAVYTAL
jgi:hypothetical protein